MSCYYFLYPFKWQHVFIPILPDSLIDILDAPLPFIIGINDSPKNLKNLLDKSNPSIIVILDTGEITYCDPINIENFPCMETFRIEFGETFNKSNKPKQIQKDFNCISSEDQLIIMEEISELINKILHDTIISKLPEYHEIHPSSFDLDNIKIL